MDEYEKGMMLDAAEWSENVSREQKVKNREFITLDQYLQLKEEYCKLKENALDTFNENTKLRELLKECYPYINREFEKQTMAENYNKNRWQQSLKLLDEIDAATSYDCGKEGYKTKREIELEKKLEIAVNLLAAIDFQLDVYLDEPNAEHNFSNSRLWQFRRPIKEALKEIKECPKNTD